MTNKERLVLTETRRLWTQTARSRNPTQKVSEPKYRMYFDCPACKYHGNSRDLRRCPGNCLLSPVWGSTEPGACESDWSPYRHWIWPHSKRQQRSDAWKIINGIETMLWNDRLG